jgi:hypothetical protein
MNDQLKTLKRVPRKISNARFRDPVFKLHKGLTFQEGWVDV